MSEAPLFPAFLYIYNKDGRYGNPVVIHSEEELNSADIKLKIQTAINDKREVRITDPMDLLVFHSENGVILFPPRKQSYE